MAERSTKLESAGFSPRIVCGPFVRYVSHNSAVIWMEMNRTCEVTVILSRLRRPERRINAKTFRVGLRFYVMVPIEKLLPSTWYEYQINAQTTDSTITAVWPVRSRSGPLPYSTFQTFPRGQGTNLRIAYLSCRAVQTEIEDKEIKKITEADALKVYALRILADYNHRQLRWPHLIVMMGDQVYADMLSPYMRKLISASHKAQGLPEEVSEVVLTFEEHAILYNDSWSDEDVCWLLSCIPSLMIFDDHEVIDDWNTSKEWLKKKQSQDWWFSKFEADLTAYWIYQGAGNLSPSEWRSDERMVALIPPTYSHNRDVTPKLHSLFSRYATGAKKIRWSYVRDIGSTRIIVADNRARRDVINRKMMDDEEWNWFADSVRRSTLPNLLIVFSLPFLLPEGIHELESSSESSTQFPWNLDPLTNLIEAGTEVIFDTDIRHYIKERIDLEQWSAFSKSFNAMLDLLEEVMVGPHTPKRLLAILSGDVHFSYNMKGRLLKAPLHPIYQFVSSPAMNKLSSRKEQIVRLISSPLGATMIEVGRIIAAAHGLAAFLPPGLQSAAQKTRLKWDPLNKGQDWPLFGNFVATLVLYPGLMQCTYERADVIKDGVQKKGDPYPGRLTRVLSFTENIT